MPNQKSFGIDPYLAPENGRVCFLFHTLSLLNQYSIGNDTRVDAPALPTTAPPKDPKAEMQDFLDDLLS